MFFKMLFLVLRVLQVNLCVLVMCFTLGPHAQRPWNPLGKELCILLLSHLLCLLQCFGKESLVWAVIRTIQVSGYGPQASSNWASLGVDQRLGMCGPGHVCYHEFSTCPHAFHLRTTSLCMSHAKRGLGCFHLSDSSNSYVSKRSFVTWKGPL